MSNNPSRKKIFKAKVMKEGEIHNSTLDAVDERDAKELLKAQGFEIISLSEMNSLGVLLNKLIGKNSQIKDLGKTIQSIPGKEPPTAKEKREGVKPTFDFKKLLSAAAATYIYREDLEIFKTILTDFLNVGFSLDWLLPSIITNDLIQRIEKFRVSKEYCLIKSFSKKSYYDVNEYEKDFLLLLKLLSFKGFEFGKEEMSQILKVEKYRQMHLNFRKIIYSSNAHTLRDYLENLVIVYRGVISNIRDFSKVFDFVAINNFSSSEELYNKLATSGVDIENLRDSFGGIPEWKYNFDSEENARLFMIMCADRFAYLVKNFKELLVENKIELKNKEGEIFNNKTLIQEILDIRSSEIDNYEVKKSLLCDFKVSNCSFSLDLMNADLESDSKGRALAEMAKLFTKAGKVKDGEKFYENLLSYEKLANSSMGNNIAIPRAASDIKENVVVGIGISKKGIDFESFDGRLVKIIFMFTWNDVTLNNPALRLKVIARISKFLKEKSIRESLKNSESAEEVFLLIKENFNSNE